VGEKIIEILVTKSGRKNHWDLRNKKWAKKLLRSQWFFHPLLLLRYQRFFCPLFVTKISMIFSPTFCF
jgi:hypothetical protein